MEKSLKIILKDFTNSEMAVFLLFCFPKLSPPSAVSVAVQSDSGKEVKNLPTGSFLHL